jgi:chemotaxis signal transduction protein
MLMTMTVPHQAAERYALLAVDGVEYAVDAAWVRRSLPAPSPLPAAVLHGGAAYPLVDLRQLFGLPATSATPARTGGGPGPERLILLIGEPPAAAGAAAPEAAAAGAVHRLALVIDDLLGLEALATGAAVPLPDVYRGPERRWFHGVLPRADGRITVLLRPEGLAPGAAPPAEPEGATTAAAPSPGGAAC